MKKQLTYKIYNLNLLISIIKDNGISIIKSSGYEYGPKLKSETG